MGQDTGGGAASSDGGGARLSVQLERVRRGDGVCLPLNPAVVLLLSDTVLWETRYICNINLSSGK